jgi:hypothetical protein
MPAPSTTALNRRLAKRDKLPARGIDYEVVRRQAGVGSLGQPVMSPSPPSRAAASREKPRHIFPPWKPTAADAAMTVSATTKKPSEQPPGLLDPYQLVTGKWVIRRLSPDSNPIELAHLPDERDDEVLLYAKAQPSLAFLPYGSAWPPCWDFPTRSRPLHVSRRWP